MDCLSIYANQNVRNFQEFQDPKMELRKRTMFLAIF